MEILKNPNFDFIGKTRYFVALSLLFIATGIVNMATRGVKYGVEFSGGTQLIVKFEKPPQTDRIRTAVESIAPGAVIQSYDDPAKNQVLVRVAGAEAEDSVDSTGQKISTAQKILNVLKTGYADNPVQESSHEIVGPVVGSELRQKAIWLTVFGLLAQLIYIGFRFQGAVWGSAAAVASLHDVLITIGFLSLAGYEITLNVIAALLTLVGYSVNDTIVVFDRVRENLRQHRKEPLAKVLNDSLNQTLSRTVISNGTTFLAVLALYLFGGEVLKGFAFAMVIGILVGTYSTIYIASPIVLWWRKASGTTGAAKAA
jgi:preprotein translocase subunit SecF